jgi:hypothetical protein
MRLLLDECVDIGLRHLFAGHECHSASYVGLAGLKNGALLSAAEAAGFEAIITVDQNIPGQQNLSVDGFPYSSSVDLPTGSPT